MNFYIIEWKGFYYCGYTTDSGSLWNQDPNRCLWMDDKEKEYHLELLIKLEDIPRKDIEERKV